MRGADIQQDTLFSTVNPGDRVPSDHPLQPIRSMVNHALKELNPEFELLYSHTGRGSIPPEKLLRAQLLMILYTIRSERMLMEQINYNLLFRWFVGFSMDDEVWNHSTFTKNRDRLLEGKIAHKFFAQIKGQTERAGLLSSEHFSVDGTLLEALASIKSFRPKDEEEPPHGGGRNRWVNFKGEKLKRETHQSTTDPDAYPFKKGQFTASKLSYMGHVLMENRNGLVVDAQVTQATGSAEREAAIEMISALEGNSPVTLGADKGYDTEDFVSSCRLLKATPHVAQNNTNRSSAIDGRTTRHPSYKVSQRIRKRVEECFGWAKTVGGIRKSQFIGKEKLDFQFTLTFAAFNLVRMRNLGLASCG